MLNQSNRFLSNSGLEHFTEKSVPDFPGQPSGRATTDGSGRATTDGPGRTTTDGSGRDITRDFGKGSTKVTFCLSIAI